MWSHRLLTGILAVKGTRPVRPVKLAAVAAGLVATAFTLPVAHADDQTDAFLTEIHRVFPDTPDDAAIISLGHAICDGMDQGLTYNQMGQIMQVGIPEIGPEGAGAFIRLAVSAFCPAHMPDIRTTAPPPAPAPPPASAADPAYLDALHQHGIWGRNGDEGMISAAHQICNDLDSGRTIEEVTASSIEANPAMRPEQISYAIVAARQYYCPWRI